MSFEVDMTDHTGTLVYEGRAQDIAAMCKKTKERLECWGDIQRRSLEATTAVQGSEGGPAEFEEVASEEGGGCLPG